MSEQGVDPGKALVPAPEHAEKVRTGFWKKMARVAAKIPFATEVLAAYYAARDPGTPRTTKGLILAALAYFVTPIDAIPDVFAGIGFTDDAAVITAMLALVGAAIRPQHRKAAEDWLAKNAR